MSSKEAEPAHIEFPATAADNYVARHLGCNAADVQAMLEAVGASSLVALTQESLPAAIHREAPLVLPGLAACSGGSEAAVLAGLRSLAGRNRVWRSLLGLGYHDCYVPSVLLRSLFCDPGWYTPYTPYQAEISQGRLEALLNFQTMVADLTGLPVANASLLDEATAAAEAMHMCQALARGKPSVFVASAACHPQTLAVLATRASAAGVDLRVVPEAQLLAADGAALGAPGTVSGVLLQYPTTDGCIVDYAALVQRAQAAGASVVVAADLLSLTLLKPPGEFGADIVVGSAQRFGVPLGFGGPHAAFMATRDAYKRQMPGRIIGISRDANGQPAYRMALQTREQHIRREKATSNICTAQALLAIMAGMYAVYHGPQGLKRIAARVHALAKRLAQALDGLGQGWGVGAAPFFDTLRVTLPPGLSATALLKHLSEHQINVRALDERTVVVALDEKSSEAEVERLAKLFAGAAAGVLTGAARGPEVGPRRLTGESAAPGAVLAWPAALVRTSPFLTQPVFNSYHTEHEMLRYLTRLRQRDLSLAQAMIPLGSCTMKLNAATAMLPVSWPEFADLHPFAPQEQAAGYLELFEQLERWLAEITGMSAVSLQPNAGSQGEYAGLLAIRAYLRSRGEARRRVCLIPASAHGTNPASAVMAGMQVVPVACDAQGNVDVADLRAQVAAHRDDLAALMITYPSTHGVFEASIVEICEQVHACGGQVYLDGANMNAQVGLCRPGDYGADVCHLNLHKTFAIPHGGGGPGVGPICVAAHLAPFLPTHPLRAAANAGAAGVGPVAAAPWGSASILPIAYAYIALMGASGLRQASQMAILNANYMVARLKEHFPILYVGQRGRVAHEFIIDLRPFKQSAGIEAEDVAKRLMDYGFHAPTMSFPVPGTLMVEPTESESKAELDRFCAAMVAIRAEIAAIERGTWPRDNNPLVQAPHTAAVVTASAWERPYSREEAAFPAPWLRDYKFWPHVGRIDNVWGDRNLVCSCN